MAGALDERRRLKEKGCCEGRKYGKKRARFVYSGQGF